jgi:hypothetical protein
MRRDALTRADQELIGSLPVGVQVTARQLERWYQAGLIPKPEARWGEVRGSISRYPAGTAEQVTELVAILKKGRRLDHAMLRLFMRRYPVHEKALKAIYLAFYGRFTSDADALDQAEQLVGKLEPRMSRDGFARTIGFRLRKRVTASLPIDSLVKGVIAQTLAAFLSGTLDDDYEGTAVAEIRAACGVDSMETDPIGNHGPLLPRLSDEEVKDMVTAVSLDAVVRAARGASWADLAEAREQWVHTVRLLSDLAEVSRRTGRKRDYAGLALFRKVARDEILLGLFVPAWIALAEALRVRGVALDPLWDPATPQGREYAELFHLLAKLARSTSMPVSNETLPKAMAAAPEELRGQFAAWVERRHERTILV